MRGLSIILAGLIQIFGSFLFAQQYTSGYSTGYESDPYQPSRSYPLVVYHPEPAATTCLTCNDCQVVNQMIVLSPDVLLFEANRAEGTEVKLTWEFLSGIQPDQIEIWWRQEKELEFQLLDRLGPHALQAWHQLAPPDRLLYQLVVSDEAGNHRYSRVREVEAIEQTLRLQIFPNPGYDFLYLKINGWEGHATVYLTDVYGRTVVQTNLAFKSGEDASLEIPALLATGMYWVEVRGERQSWKLAWIRQN